MTSSPTPVHRLRRLVARAPAWAVGPADPIRLDTLRVLLGVNLLFYTLEWWQAAPEWLTSRGFHPSSQAMPLVFWDVPVLPLLPEAALPWFGAFYLASILAWTLGWRLVVTTWVLLGCMVYVTLADGLAAFTMNDFYIVALGVFALAPKGCWWSVQARPLRAQSLWPIRILQATLLVQYFTAGVCKISHGDWLEDPYVLWSQAQGAYMTDIAAHLFWVLPRATWSWMQYVALSFECVGVFLFLIPRFRPLALLWGLGFHLMIALTMKSLIYFAAQMVAFYVLFLGDAQLHRVRLWLRGAVARVIRRGAAAEHAVAVNPVSRAARFRHIAAFAALLLVYVLPMGYRGIVGAPFPGMPHVLVKLQNISCLFIHRVQAWPVHYIQVRPEPGAAWQEVPVGDFFGMRLFGYTTRLDEYFRKKIVRSSLARAELSTWLRDRHAELHPEAPPPAAVRVVTGLVPLRSDMRSGRWRRPTLDSFAPGSVRISFAHEFDAGGTAREVR